MKAIQSIPLQEEIDDLTIPEAEEIIEEALEELSFSTDPGMVRALRFLAPPGYQAIVELCGENGRSKRRNANASSWTPDEDEVRIYFERIDGESEEEDDHSEGRSAPQARNRTPRVSAQVAEDGNVEDGGALPADIDDRIKELCATLAEAERGEVIGVAIAAVSPNSMVRATWCGMANTSTMMAAITAMEALYKRAWLDGMAG